MKLTLLQLLAIHFWSPKEYGEQLFATTKRTVEEVIEPQLTKTLLLLWQVEPKLHKTVSLLSEIPTNQNFTEK